MLPSLWEGGEERAGRAPPQSHSKGNLVVAAVVRLKIFGISQRQLYVIGQRPEFRRPQTKRQMISRSKVAALPVAVATTLPVGG